MEIKKELKVFLSLGFKNRSKERKNYVKEMLIRGFKRSLLDWVNEHFNSHVRCWFEDDDLCINEDKKLSVIKINFIDNDIDYNEPDKNIRMFRKGMALQKISECDVIVYCENDYNSYDGVRLEIDLCKKYEILSVSFKSKLRYEFGMNFGFEQTNKNLNDEMNGFRLWD